MRKILIGILLSALPCFAQVSNPGVVAVPSTPSTCNTLPLKVVSNTNNVYGTNGSGGCAAIGGGVAPGSNHLSCQPGLGDGLNAIPAGTYLQTTCRNETGATWTLTAIRCVADAGSSTCNATNSAGTGLLSSAVTGTSTYANGTQSATTTIASGDYLKITFIADGTTKQIGIDLAGTF